MIKSKKIIAILYIVLTTILLTSCNFHIRQDTDFPKKLNTIIIETKQPYSKFITELKNMLDSLGINLTKKPKRAAYKLKVISIEFNKSSSPITTTTLAITITYSLSVTLKLVTAKEKVIIATKKLTAYRYISQNPSQIYTPGATSLARQELYRDIISQIYYLLASQNTKKALKNYVNN